ncbi:Chaperone protein dnaJ A6 [Linum grandiflorum]
MRGAGHGAQSPFDIFESFFGGRSFRGGCSRAGRQQKGDNVLHPLMVSLEDLYNGTTKKLKLSRNVICSKCRGKGSKSGASETCYGCQGAGRIVTTLQVGIGMIRQVQQVCPDCRGAGELISVRDRCTHCKGRKVAQETNALEVPLEKGMREGQKIVIKGQADEAPGTAAGDIIFVLKLKEHPKFKLKYDDLEMEHTLSLKEALCGFQFAVTHLDGRQVLIKSDPGEVTKPGTCKEINDEGMRKRGRPLMKGKLYIRFNVEFPEAGTLSVEQCRKIERILPSKSSGKELSDMELDDCEETTLHDVNMAEEEQKQEQGESYDEDDEGEAYDEDDEGEAYDEDGEDEDPSMERVD